MRRALSTLATVGLVSVLLPASASALNFSAASGNFALKKVNDAEVKNLVVDDFNGDGRDDIVRVGIGQFITVYLGQLGESFSGPTNYGGVVASDTLTERSTINKGDFNGDGKLDVVVTGPGRTAADPVRYEVFFGDGAGGFPGNGGLPSTAGPVSASGSIAGSDSTALADVNNDGRPDLVVGMNDHKVAVALGNSSGQFTPAPGSPFNIPVAASNGAGDAMSSIAVGNFTGDSSADVALIQEGASGGLYIAQGNGTGSLTPLASNPVISAGGAAINTVVGIQLDGSGTHRDLAITQPTSLGDKVRTLLGGTSGPTENTTGGGIALNGGPVRQFVDDVDGDGKQDLLVVLQSSKQVAVLFGNGAGGLAEAEGSPYWTPDVGTNVHYFPVAVATGNFNGDGFRDLAVAMSGTSDGSKGIGVQISRPSRRLSEFDLHFPDQAPGDTSPVQHLTISNDRGSPPLTGGGPFALAGNQSQYLFDTNCGAILNGGSSCTINIAYHPQSEGNHDTSLTIHHSNVGNVEVDVYGNTGYASGSPDEPYDNYRLNFGALVGYAPSYETQTITMRSTGSRVLQIAGSSISPGPDAGDFQLVSPNTCNGSLAPGQTCQVSVKFAPQGTVPREFDATLTMDMVNDRLGDADFHLIGSTVVAGAHLLSPTSQDFGSAAIGAVGSTETITLRAGNLTSVFAYDGYSISGPDAADFQVTSYACAHYVNISIPCQFDVTYFPRSGSPGPRNASLDFDLFSTSGNSKSVPLTAIATRPTDPGSGSLDLELKGPKKAKRGKVVKVNATITNPGTASVDGVVLRASAPRKIAKGPKPIEIGTLKPGEPVNSSIKFKISRKAKPGKKFKAKVIVEGEGLTAQTVTTTPVKIR